MEANWMKCYCHTCRPIDPKDPESVYMRLCPLCGNKRCPKATDHNNECSGSNDAGQIGSIYGVAIEVREKWVYCVYEHLRWHTKKKLVQHVRTSTPSEVHTVLVHAVTPDQCQNTRKNPSVQPSKSGWILIKAKWHDGNWTTMMRLSHHYHHLLLV